MTAKNCQSWGSCVESPLIAKSLWVPVDAAWTPWSQPHNLLSFGVEQKYTLLRAQPASTCPTPFTLLHGGGDPYFPFSNGLWCPACSSPVFCQANPNQPFLINKASCGCMNAPYQAAHAWCRWCSASLWLCGALILGKTWEVQVVAGAGSGELPLPPN